MYWIQHLEYGLKRVNHAAVVFGKEIYSFGGYCSEEHMSSQMDIFVFNTVSLEWRRLQYSNKGDIPPGLFGHTAVTYKNKVYVWGGIDYRNQGSSTLFCFDIAALTWTSIQATGHMPKATDGHSACIISDFMYIFGGFEADSEVLVNMLYRIDLNTSKWERIWTKGTPPSPRDFHTASVIGNRMYIFGGRSFLNSQESDEIYYNEIIYFDTDSMTWVKPQILGDEPRGRRSHSAAVYNGEIYIFGGCSPDYLYHLLHLNDVHKFNPEQNRWSELCTKGNGPSPRRRHCSVVIDEQLYLFGGSRPMTQMECGSPLAPFLDAEFSPPRLKEENDLFIMDLCPTLKRLCQLKVIEYEYNVGIFPTFTSIPIHLQNEIQSLRKRQVPMMPGNRPPVRNFSPYPFVL